MPVSNTFGTSGNRGSSVGHRRRGETVTFKVCAPHDVFFAFEAILQAGSLGKPIYGLRSQTITDLMDAYCKRIHAEAQAALQKTPEEAKVEIARHE